MSETTTTNTTRGQLTAINDDYTARYGFHDPEDYFLKAPKGLNHEVVEMISRKKNVRD